MIRRESAPMTIVPGTPTSRDFVDRRGAVDRLLVPEDKPVISRRRLLAFSLLLSAGYVVGVPPVGQSPRDAAAALQQPGEHARLIPIIDAAEDLLGDRVTNPFARFDLGLKGPKRIID